MKPIDYILIIVLLAVFIFALRKTIKDRKNKKCCSCSGDCSTCGKKKN